MDSLRTSSFFAPAALRPCFASCALALGACVSDTGNAVDDLAKQALLDSGARKPPCVERDSQVVLFGDSYISWVSHTFPEDLNAIAGAQYRNYAVGGYSMATGGIGSIPSEFDTALAEDPDILFAIIDGGGNDILVPDIFQFPDSWWCKNSTSSPTISDCQEIVARALEAADQAMVDLADAGVRDVVYFFYPQVPEGTLIGGLHPNEILNYALPMARELCDGAVMSTDGRLACHFVDLVPVFEGHPEYFAPTDIHPNSRGSKAMAEAIWDKMTTECLGQPESSGCCEPALADSPQ